MSCFKENGGLTPISSSSNRVTVCLSYIFMSPSSFGSILARSKSASPNWTDSDRGPKLRPYLDWLTDRRLSDGLFDSDVELCRILRVGVIGEESFEGLRVQSPPKMSELTICTALGSLSNHGWQYNRTTSAKKGPKISLKIGPLKRIHAKTLNFGCFRPLF